MANLFGQPNGTAQQGFDNDLLSYYTGLYGSAAAADALGQGALTNTPYMAITQGQQAENVNFPRLQGQGGNAASNQTRTQAPLALAPQVPQQRIGLNEGLIRTGGAMVGASQDGGLQAFQAGTDMYGQIEDYNRSQALAEYNAQISANAKQAQINKQEAAAAAKAKKAATGAVSPYNAVVLQTIDDIIPVLDKDINGWLNQNLGMGGWTTGTLGELMKGIGGTGARDLNAKLETLRSNIGFDRLQKMRMDSPTGGALGSVSERELSQLNSALGNLEQSQSPEQLKENLIRIRDQYERAIIALQNDYAADGMTFNNPIAQGGSSSGNSSLSAADAIVGFR